MSATHVMGTSLYCGCCGTWLPSKGVWVAVGMDLFTSTCLLSTFSPKEKKSQTGHWHLHRMQDCWAQDDHQTWLLRSRHGRKTQATPVGNKIQQGPERSLEEKEIRWKSQGDKWNAESGLRVGEKPHPTPVNKHEGLHQHGVPPQSAAMSSGTTID